MPQRVRTMYHGARKRFTNYQEKTEDNELYTAAEQAPPPAYPGQVVNGPTGEMYSCEISA